MKLILPNHKYYQSYIEARNEYKDQKVTTYEFLEGSEADIFKRIEDYRLGNDLPETHVKATFLWLVDEDEFIGEISIRHELNDALLRFGGNIGYGVRYSFWNKGYGTKMLELTLKYAKEEVGLSKVLITCNDDNYGSAQVIENNGGILQDKILNNINGVTRITRRYWINL